MDIVKNTIFFVIAVKLIIMNADSYLIFSVSIINSFISLFVLLEFQDTSRQLQGRLSLTLLKIQMY